MKLLILCVSAIIIAATLYLYLPRQDQQQEQFVTQSSALIKQLATSLKQELSTAIKKHGVPAAIQTCNIQAPILTAQSHADSSLTIRRTSLKLRNRTNAPDAWEMGVLNNFERQLAQDTPIDQLTFTEVTNDNGNKVRRHMRAIPTQGVCLSCHGDEKTLSTEVKNMLNKEYPNDLATGFAVGDIRGAFSVSQPIDN